MKKGNKLADEIKEADKPAKPLTRKEVEEQIQSGNLTKEQAIKLRQEYMDTLEYNEEEFVTSCGGIRSLPILLPKDKE